MTRPISPQDIFNSHHRQLGLEWVTGQDTQPRVLQSGDEAIPDATLVGYLNLVRPNRIQVLGHDELDYLSGLKKNSYADALLHLFEAHPLAVIIADGREVPEEIVTRAAPHTPVLKASASSNKTIDHLRYYLTSLLTEKVIKHGVFMEVLGIGVLLTGPSGVGKSELALELLSRGHRLIADDVPEFSRTAPDTIIGTCPKILADFLEVRGLGVLNVRAMFGNNAVIGQKRLRLIVQLEEPFEPGNTEPERLDNSGRTRRILDVDIAEVSLPVAPGRDLAVIIEAAVRNHVLYLNGYNAAQDFIERQQELINKNQS